MNLRVKNCCFYISLRTSCLTNALILAFFQLIAVPVQYKGALESFQGVLVAAYCLVHLIHSMGCLVLFFAFFVRFAALLLVFLTTNSMHIILTPIFLILDLVLWNHNFLTLGLGLIGILFSIYFWVVARSYYYQCKEEVYTDRPTLYSVTFANENP